MIHSLPHSQWYDEGKLAAQQNKDKSECPYKQGSYGYAEWNRGYNEFLLTMEK